MNIVHTIYKLKMIFPSLFFNSIENLPIHLPFKTKVRDMIQFRWMYPLKRLRITHASQLNFYCPFKKNSKHLFNFI